MKVVLVLLACILLAPSAYAVPVDAGYTELLCSLPSGKQSKDLDPVFYAVSQVACPAEEACTVDTFDDVPVPCAVPLQKLIYNTTPCGGSFESMPVGNSSILHKFFVPSCD